MSKHYPVTLSHLQHLADKTVAIIGYGNQGAAQAKNLRDSGVRTIIGLRPTGNTYLIAKDDGFEVYPIAEAVAQADLIVMLMPDESIGQVFTDQVQPHVKTGATLGLAHGFAVHFETLTVPGHMNVVLMAPKGTGAGVRSQYLAGTAVPFLLSVYQDATGTAEAVALAYLAGQGAHKSLVLGTTIKEETETDLFGEQAVLCGGMVNLMQAGFEVLVEAGYSPEAAYFECIHEMKLVIDLVNARGIAGMNLAISDTAEYGEYTSGNHIVPLTETKARMHQVLAKIQDGSFAQAFMKEHAADKPTLATRREQTRQHPMEKVGNQLRQHLFG